MTPDTNALETTQKHFGYHPKHFIHHNCDICTSKHTKTVNKIYILERTKMTQAQEVSIS